MRRLLQLLTDHELFHSEFQIRNLIVCRAGGTVFGAYKQAVRELWSRLTGIASELERIESLGGLDAVGNSAIKGVAPFHLQIGSSNQIINSIRDTLRETVILYNLASTLRDLLGDLNPEKKAMLEEELWLHRVKSAIAVDFISIGGISAPTVELLHALPIKIRQPVLDLLLSPSAHDSVVLWYLNDSLELPTLDSYKQEAGSRECLEDVFEALCWFGLPKNVEAAKSIISALLPCETMKERACLDVYT
jgi:hypothetical protein